MGVPLDNVTVQETIEEVERLVASGQPHYLVTANVDFLVQARRDIELRRILLDAHMVLCDGTPLVWAARLLGNALPERVAGADLVPLLIEQAAARGYRIFFLGAKPGVAAHAVKRLTNQWPGLQVAGYYSPPFNKLLEMDHDEIQRRLIEAKPDLLFVCFGCPKQEKWLAMHYRALQVPVCIGVGATIDFLAGQVKRAPVWMRRSGLEWLFRLIQEPRRLFRRYANDLAVFGVGIVREWWSLGRGSRKASTEDAPEISAGDWLEVTLPETFNYAALQQNPFPWSSLLKDSRDCIVLGWAVDRIDSTGLGVLMKLERVLRQQERKLVVASPSRVLAGALRFARLDELLEILPDVEPARELLQRVREETVPVEISAGTGSLLWRGEVTAANATQVWQLTRELIDQISPTETWKVDMSRVRFIDSTGLSLMIRLRKLAQQAGTGVRFTALQPAVRNVLRLAHMEKFLLSPAPPDTAVAGKPVATR